MLFVVHFLVILTTLSAAKSPYNDNSPVSKVLFWENCLATMSDTEQEKQDAGKECAELQHVVADEGSNTLSEEVKSKSPAVEEPKTDKEEQSDDSLKDQSTVESMVEEKDGQAESSEAAVDAATGETVKSETVSPAKKKDTFPDTLDGFGYHFVDGVLKNIATGDGYAFVVKPGDDKYNQAHYEAIGTVITGEVYKMLESECGLKRINIPAGEKKECSFFFSSEDALTADKLMVIIHGSGVVRAGQWSRSLIINHNVESGTQIPYIKRAIAEGYGVVVTNTNEVSKIVKGKKKAHNKSESPEQHAYYVWQNYIKKSKAEEVNIVAHSYGGVVTLHLLNSFYMDFKKRVKKIAFTDSAHCYNPVKVPVAKWQWLAEHATDWVSSDAPLDTTLPPGHDGIPLVSAGTTKHIETSWKAFESVFKYFSIKEEPFWDFSPDLKQVQ